MPLNIKLYSVDNCMKLIPKASFCAPAFRSNFFCLLASTNKTADSRDRSGYQELVVRRAR